MRLTIAKKLALGTGALLAVFLVFGLFSIFQTRNINKNIKDIAEVKEPISASAYEMEINLIGTGFAVLGYLHDHDPKHLERIKEDKREFEDFQKRYRKLAGPGKGQELGDRVVRGYAEFITLAYELIKLEDEQTRKMEAFAKKLDEIDDILEISTKPDAPQADDKQRASMEMEINVFEIANGMANYMRTHSSAVEARIHTDEQDFRENIEEYKNLKLSSEERQWAMQIGRLFEENIRLVKDITTLDQAKEKELAKFVQLRRVLGRVLNDGIQALTHTGLAAAKDDAINAARKANAFIAIAMFLTLGIGTLGVILIVRNITRPVRRLVEATAVIAKGNFSLKIAVGSKDEMGILANSFNRMAEELQKTMVSRDYVQDIIQSMSDALIVVSPEGMIQTANPPACALFGYEEKELPCSMYDKVSDASALIDAATKGPVQNIEKTYLSKDGRQITAIFSSSVLRGGEGVICTAKDITEIKRADEKILSQMKLLTALQTIDMTIISSFDLQVILNAFLEQATAILEADAVSVLILNPHTLVLCSAASCGFITPALQHTTLRIGEGHAGSAALERRIISIPNLVENPGELSRSDLLAKEGFVSYYAVPLIAKGQVMGVLEIFHRTPLIYEQERLDLLKTLSAQAAIIIDNTTLFDNLQRSNIELMLAYDTTLEGWSHALDYRDKETEGHSLRVTEMTLEIGRILGIDEKELVNIRRGALLHDIGKLGVPDSILLKPGKLTDEEWVIMKKHPVIAYEILSPIAFLRLAIDIPYSHHEKWNGTGYPRGLKGEHIPLAARIFTVVDIWDALHSERPYRPAWSKEKIIEYIRSLSGIELDPRVVEVFLKMINEKNS